MCYPDEELSCEVEGPGGKIPVTIDAPRAGKQTVVFTPREEGEWKTQ